MSFTIRNIRPSVLHIPDSGLRLDSGETAVVEMLSPQMEVLVANQALVFLAASEPDSPAVIVPVAEISTATEPEIIVESLPEIPVVGEASESDQLAVITSTDETCAETDIITENVPDVETPVLPEMVAEPEPAAVVTGQQTKKSAAEKYKNAQ
jgi:hypothetical protein